MSQELREREREREKEREKDEIGFRRAHTGVFRRTEMARCISENSCDAANKETNDALGHYSDCYLWSQRHEFKCACLCFELYSYLLSAA